MLEIIKYEESYKERWDDFVIKRSFNGTFLQTRNFLNYHPKGRFDDSSIMIMQGTTIVAVIPATVIYENGEKQFISHRGSTFGGIVVDKSKYNIKNIIEIFECLEMYFRDAEYDTVILKQSSNLFSKKKNDLLEYFFFKNDWKSYKELSFYIDIKKLPEDVISIFSSSRRRDYRYSVKNELYFKRLETDEEVSIYYDILQENLLKFDQKPVHTLSELIDFKNNRLRDIVEFYGVYTPNGKMIAGTMVFLFEKKVFHTQYLAQRQSDAERKLYAMEFLDCNLIMCARASGYEYFSFGISTEQCGKVLNTGLALFKEGFGCEFCNNTTYIKKINSRKK